MPVGPEGCITREENNQQGKDKNYEQLSAYIHSPAKLELYRPRQIFHKRDGAMRVNAHENRFEPFDHMNLNCSKYAKYQSPAIDKKAIHSLDEFIKNPSNCRDENANH